MPAYSTKYACIFGGICRHIQELRLGLLNQSKQYNFSNIKTMKKLFLSLAIVAMAIFAASCSKENKDEPRPKTEGEVAGEITINATDYSKWVYFSFDKGAVVEVADPKSSLDWDLGFHFLDFRTNSGASGKGGGGALVTNLKAVSDKLDAIPSSDKFVQDILYDFVITKMPNMSGGGHGAPTYEQTGANPVLTSIQKIKIGPDGKPERRKSGSVILIPANEGAAIFDHAKMPPRMGASDKVFLVRTAKGKLAKIKVLDITDAHDNVGHIKMQYSYIK